MDPKAPVTAAEASVTLREAVRAEQIRLLVENHGDRYLTLLVAGIVIAVVRSNYPAWLLASWFGLTFCALVMRSWLGFQFHSAPRGPTAVRRWAVLFSSGAAVTGGLWGCAGSIALVTPSPALQFFSVMIVGGMMAGGVMINAAYCPAMAAFAIPTILPCILALFSRGDLLHAGMGVLLMLFGLVISAAALKLNRVIVQNIQLRFEHDALLTKVQTSEAAMAEAQRLAQTGSWEIDLATGIITMSTEGYHIFGCSPADDPIAFASVLARIHPDDRDRVNMHVAMSKTASAASGIDFRRLMPDGTIKHVNVMPSTIFDPDGRALRIFGSVQDITERRLAEERLQFANLLMKTQMEASQDGILVVDGNRHASRSNRRFAEIWGLPVAAMVNPDDDAVRTAMAALVKAPSQFRSRLRFLAEHPEVIGNEEIEMADGRTLARYSRSLQSNAGQRLGRVWFYTDITERRAAEQKLQFANILLGTQMEASPDGIIVVDQNRRIISFNHRFAEMWRIPIADLLSGANDAVAAQLKSQISDPKSFNARVDYLTEHPGDVGDDEIESHDGRTFDRHSVSLHTADGDYLGRAWFFSDITERRAAEQKLQFANVLLNTQMEASPDGIMVFDASSKATSFNRRFSEIWMIPMPVLQAGDDSVIRPWMRSQIRNVDRYAARVQYLHENPDEIGDDEIETLDGRFLERHSAPLRSIVGGDLGRIRFYRDVTEHKKAAATLDYRDRLLHAVTAATSIAVRAVSLADGMPVALAQLGESMGVHRIVVMEDMVRESPPLVVRFHWEIPGIAVSFTKSASMRRPLDPMEIDAWRQLPRDGQVIFADANTAPGAIRRMLDLRGTKSSILTPVYVGGQIWGFIIVDDCLVPRQWTASEIETLRILADTAGALIVRDRARIELEASEALFRLLTVTANDAVILAGPEGEVLQWNPTAERIFGYTAAEAIGKQSLDLIVRPQDRALVSRSLDREDPELSATLEFTFMRKDGSEVATEISVSAVPIGNRHGILNILRDVTERKKEEVKLQFANVMLKTQMEASPDGIVVIGADRRLLSYNQRFADMWHFPTAVLATGDGNALRAWMTTLVKDKPRFIAWTEHIVTHADSVSAEELEIADGRFMEINSRSLQDGAADSLGRVWFYRDVTARRRAEALALRLARYDVLTGLANRGVFVEAVEHAIAGAKRGGLGFAVLFLDLDNFKNVNDTLGHPAGDALLKEVADRLRANSRDTDTVARFGGDEFAIVVVDIKDPADAATLADKLINALNAPFLIRYNEIHTAASIGIDLYSDGTDDVETLLSHADIALYRAKADGRGVFRFFTDAMDRQVRARIRLGRELHDAITRNEFFLLYQPQVQASSGRITGLEALVRWRHPARGILTPGYFVPVAEDTGVIGQLGHFVLWEACRQAKDWLDAGLPISRMAVNISATQLKAPEVLESDIIAALAATGMPPHLLELELTESVLMDASREHSTILLNLRELGVKLALDDFGTGYSSLDYLRRFPVDRLKIAQSFARHVEAGKGDASIVRAMIGLARELNIEVIVEGVETKSQLELLERWNCGEVQGYYFAKPLEASEIAALFLNGGIIDPESPQAKAARVSAPPPSPPFG